MSYSDAETNQRLKIPVNTFTLPALMIVSTGTALARLRRLFHSIQATS